MQKLFFDLFRSIILYQYMTNFRSAHSCTQIKDANKPVKLHYLSWTKKDSQLLKILEHLDAEESVNVPSEVGGNLKQR